MSPAEALMWNVEKDPWLNPSGGSLSLLDGPVDGEEVDRWLQSMVAAVPRLRERVVPGFGRFERPSWRPDPEFDFGYHVRHVDLPGDGTERDLLDLVAVLFQEPYDRTRPLWQVVVIGGLEGDRSALLMKLHHSIADGYGMGRMQERFMVRDPDAPAPDPVDLDALVAETSAAADREGGSASALEQVADLVRKPAAIAQKALGRAALLAADPTAWGDVVTSARGMAGMVAGQLRPDDEGDAEPAGSPLWTGRSRHRHLEAIRLPLSDTKRVAKALDASINDVFMTGLVGGAVAYHEARGVPVSAFNTSFVVSFRQDRAEGGNSFSPVRVRVPGAVMPPVERLRAVQERVGRQRDSFRGGGLMGSLAGVANLLPTSLTTQVARSQAARVDFATTNVRGSSRPLYIGGRLMTGIFAPGPVAGSAMIAAVISYLDTMNIMLTIDPVAIPEPAALKADIEQAYLEVFAL
jgi:WS/DGAT/MGAT family acyltransferase